MENDSIKELLKNKIDEIKTNTLDRLLINDNDYQQALKQQNLAEELYQQLKLTEDQRTTIDSLLHWTDAGNMEYGSLCYLAGLIDNSSLLKSPSTDIHSLQPKPLLKDFYWGDFIPVEIPYESPDTTNLWKEIIEEETNFDATLSPDQSSAFQQLLEKRLAGITKSTEDSFILGFKIGAKFLINIFQ